MKRLFLFLIITCLLASVATAGEIFPQATLEGKLSEAQKAYLGVTAETIQPKDIQAEYIFVEGYSMYCPICQRDAPHLNALYEAVEKEGLSKKIKMIGIALGNTPYETAFYQKKYEVQFPLFHDENYTVHKALGEVPTPTFYIVKLDTMEVLFKKVGAAETKDALLKAIKEVVN